jgi:3',5'-nucleoside bisphosphate phosphatase
LIDLHTHTTASDGRLTPDALVARAAAAGVTVLSVTDHDTTAACAVAARAADAAGIEFVTGIEITAIVSDADVHVLGYFIDAGSPALETFLARQRTLRVERVREMVSRLAMHGIRLDADAILQPVLTDPDRAVGRPWIARALVEGGHVADGNEAFERWLERGRPAFVPRTGATPEQVFQLINRAGGLSSLAHPIHLGHDDWLPRYAAAGLDALEAYHSDHDHGTTQKYVALAKRLSVEVTGGSDFHGDDAHGPSAPGRVSLPGDAYANLKARLRWV